MKFSICIWIGVFSLWEKSDAGIAELSFLYKLHSLTFRALDKFSILFRGDEIPGRFSAIFDKGDNFWEFRLLTCILAPFRKWVFSESKEFAPKGRKFFPFRKDSFLESVRTYYFVLQLNRPHFGQLVLVYKTGSCLHTCTNLSSKHCLQQKIHFNGNISGTHAIVVTRIHHNVGSRASVLCLT